MKGLEARVARNVDLAMACGAPATMLLTVALATEAPETVADAFAALKRWGGLLAEVATGRPSNLKALAELEPELCLEPELARVRSDIADHEVRGQLVFRDLLGRQSFFQVAALSIAGLRLSSADAEYLEHLGVVTQLQDVRIWPLTVTRRVGMGSGGFAHALLAGLATMLNPNMAVQPVGAFMRFLDRLESGVAAGRSAEEQLLDVMRRRERVPGVGRPALGVDERNVHVAAIVRRFGRDRGSSWQLAVQVDEFFCRTKGQHINSAGLQGAILRDMGFSPTAATAMCVLYFIVPILAHAVFAEDATRLGARRDMISAQ
jgi:hypothetical protein